LAAPELGTELRRQIGQQLLAEQAERLCQHLLIMFSLIPTQARRLILFPSQRHYSRPAILCLYLDQQVEL
jgi:hypothetical protein